MFHNVERFPGLGVPDYLSEQPQEESAQSPLYRYGQALTEEQRQEMARLYQRENWSLKQIAAFVDIDPSTVSYVLDEDGIRQRVRRKELPINAIVQDYGSGKSTSELAQLYGVHPSTIRNKLIEGGVTMRSRGGRIELPMEEIIIAREAGASLAVVAKDYGVHDQTIRRRLRAANIDTSKRGKRRTSSTERA